MISRLVLNLSQMASSLDISTLRSRSNVGPLVFASNSILGNIGESLRIGSNDDFDEQGEFNQDDALPGIEGAGHVERLVIITDDSVRKPEIDITLVQSDKATSPVIAQDINNVIYLDEGGEAFELENRATTGTHLTKEIEVINMAV